VLRNNACVTKLESFQLVAWATIIDFDYRNIHLSKYSPLHDILLVFVMSNSRVFTSKKREKKIISHAIQIELISIRQTCAKDVCYVLFCLELHT